MLKYIGKRLIMLILISDLLGHELNRRRSGVNACRR